MNSFAHYSFGAVYRWMVEVIGGIRLVEPGYVSFEIAPQPGGGLTFADVAVVTVRGAIESRWLIEGERLTMDVVVPANARCTVRVPTTRTDSIRVDGRDSGSGVFELAPGRHRIEALL
jgi:alpha-L-rhamnosidase